MNNDLIMFMSFLSLLNGPYEINYGEDYDYESALDSKLCDCQFDLYMYLLLGENDERSQKYYESFSAKYLGLSDKQKEFIKRDYDHIIEEQEKCAKENKQKTQNNNVLIKRKGEINYE